MDLWDHRLEWIIIIWKKGLNSCDKSERCFVPLKSVWNKERSGKGIRIKGFEKQTKLRSWWNVEKVRFSGPGVSCQEICTFILQVCDEYLIGTSSIWFYLTQWFSLRLKDEKAALQIYPGISFLWVNCSFHLSQWQSSVQ